MNTAATGNDIGFSAEALDRAEWRDMLASHGLEAMAAPEIPGFASRVTAAARAGERRLVLARRRAVAAVVAAAACVAAALMLPSLLVSGRGALAPSAPTAPTAPSDFLASRQSSDGTWSAPGADASFKPALTALAALALSRDGGGHSAAVAAAVAALEGMQRPDGSFGEPGPHSLYNHAFATFALLDDARRSGKGITPAIALALDFSAASQNPYAAWDYSPAGRGDDALTVWQLGLLSEARALGWRDECGTLRRGVAALARSARDGGLLDYRLAFGRESAPDAGGVILTRLATKSLAGFLDGVGGQDALSGTLAASLGAADARRASGVAAHGNGEASAVLGAIAALLE